VSAPQYVFGFGSLVALDSLARYLGRDPFAADEVTRCRLGDHRRRWNVARDNREDLADHPHYVCAVSGERLAVFVTAVNIRPAPGHAVNGVAFRVTDDHLAVLDRRERNYRRIEVSGRLDADVCGPVWAYRGTAAAEARHAAGLAAGTALVNRTYLDTVHRAFASHGPAFLAEYHATTDPPEVPSRPLAKAWPAP
jgi:cation transport regulator ChaC